jgi:hypothetical protein
MTDDVKPAFDPSQPFEPVQAANSGGDKPAFDPTKPFQPVAPDQQQPQRTWLDTAQSALGVASGALPGPLGAVASGMSQVDPALVKEAATNVPHSAAEFAKNTVQPFLHPVDTATSIKNLGLGVLEKSGIVSGNEHEKYADAVGKFYADRYGGIENAKRAFATDPVGVAGDLSMLLTGGGGAAARLPGVAGRVGEVAGAVGRSVDPLRAVAGAGTLAGRTAAEIAGATTGAGGLPIRTAAQAGYEGGQAGQAFRENMRGVAPLEDAVNEARGAVDQLRQERGNAYRQRMAAIGADKTIMSWNDVDTALVDMDRVATYKGQSLSPSTEAMRDRITGAINNWKNLRASEFWTPEGFDALKRQVGDIRDSSQPHTRERLVADQAYNAIKKTIVDQAPAYARTMSGYENASRMIKEIETTLSLKPNANIDTSLRKLQSTLRDNVNTSFGRRTELANFLARSGAPLLMERLAGQALRAWMPRGLARLATVETLPAVAGAMGAGAPGAALAAAATLPTMSPRLVGEVAHGVGRAARAMRSMAPVPRAARQIGQVTGAMTPFDNKSRNPYATP